MAAARRIKTLLTVNILVFVGIILFSVYCRLQERSPELVQIVRSADRRLRSRHAKGLGGLSEREAILQRLDHLEEVVYNQLNDQTYVWLPKTPSQPNRATMMSQEDQTTCELARIAA